MPEIFLSYRRGDTAGYAGRLRASLESRLGEGRVFRDVEALEPGQDYVDAIAARIDACRALLVLIGRDWLEARDRAGRRRLDDPDDLVRREVSSALARRDLLVIPVLVEDADMPAAEALPEELRALARRHAIELHDEDWERDVERLAQALGHVVEAPAVQPDSPPDPAAQPVARPTAKTRRIAPARTLIAVGTLVILFLALRQLLDRGDTGDPGAVTSAEPAAPSGAQQGAASERALSTTPLEVPRVAEVALGDLVFTVASATLVEAGGEQRLRLRVRASNESRYDAAVGSAPFRLNAGGSTILAEDEFVPLVPGHTVLDGTLTFRLPAGVRDVRLDLAMGERSGSIALPLLPADQPPAPDDTVDRSLVGRIPFRPPLDLLSADGLEITLSDVTVRRFANVLRIALELRVTNGGRNGIALTPDLIRLGLPDGRTLAPTRAPSDVIDSNVTESVTYAFETPVETESIVVRAFVRERRAEVPVEITAAKR